MTTPPFDTAKPNVARMYDYWLGGKDNFEIDRTAAEAVRRLRSNVAEQALDNERFQARAVTYVAGHGVRQFLDVGSGLPTSPDFASTYNAQSGPRIYAHSWPEITGLFSGLELVPPGIVETSAWLPGQPDTVPEQRSNKIVAGVGRRLLPPGSLAAACRFWTGSYVQG